MQFELSLFLRGFFSAKLYLRTLQSAEFAQLLRFVDVLAVGFSYECCF